MGKSKTKLVLAGLITIGVCVFLYFILREPPPRLQRQPHEALGQVMAREALKLREGGRVILIARDTVTFQSPASDVQLKSFFSTLKESGASVAVTNLMKLDPLRVAIVQGGEFFQILKKGTEQDVVVSFLGAPVLEPDHLAKLGARPPKVIAVCTGGVPNQVNARKSFEQKLLHAAVVSRKDVGPTPPSAPHGTQEWFDYLFTLITPANLAELPHPERRRD